MIDLKTYFDSVRSIVCLNGELPAKDLFARKANLPLIAADGAGSRLINMGIVPSIIIGDLDSVDKSTIPAHTEVISIPNQDTTDFEKVLLTIEKRELFPCLIYGATGLESDHTLYNLNIIADYSLRHRIIFHDSAYKAKEKYGIFVSDRLTANLKIGSKISLLTLTSAVVSTHGLTWDLEKTTLTPRISSARNLIRENLIEINVHNGNLLVLFDS